MGRGRVGSGGGLQTPRGLCDSRPIKWKSAGHAANLASQYPPSPSSLVRPRGCVLAVRHNATPVSMSRCRTILTPLDAAILPVTFACQPLRLCSRSAWLRGKNGQIRKETEQWKSTKAFAIQRIKRPLLLGGSLLSDIPSHFNLGKARTLNIKGFAQESEREKEMWNSGPTSTIARPLLSTELFEVNLPL